MSKKPSREQLQKQKQEARRKEELKAAQELWRLPLHSVSMAGGRGRYVFVLARKTSLGLEIGIYYLDFACRGILLSRCASGISEAALPELVDNLTDDLSFSPSSEAQLLSALATANRYAKRFGINLPPDFRKAAKLLPPDALDFPDSAEFPCGSDGVPVWFSDEEYPELPNPFQLGLIEKAGGHVDDMREDELDETPTIDYDERFCEEQDDDLYFDPELDFDGNDCERGDSHAFHVRCGEHAAWVCEEYLRRAYPEEWAQCLADDRKPHAKLHVLCLYLSSIMVWHRATPGVVLTTAECLSSLVLTEKNYKELPIWKDRPFTDVLEILKDFWLKAPEAFPGMNDEAPQAHLALLDMPDILARIEVIRVATDARYDALHGD